MGEDFTNSVEVRAADSLGSLEKIRTLSDTGRITTERMQEKFAKEFFNEGFEQKLQENIAVHNPNEREKSVNFTGGSSYWRIAGSHDTIRWCWNHISLRLPAAGFDMIISDDAETLYSAFDRGLDMYWSFLSKTAAGIRDNKVASMVGPIFRTLLQDQLTDFEAAAGRIVANIRVLGDEKAAKAQDWTKRTREKIQDVINAADGK